METKTKAHIPERERLLKSVTRWFNLGCGKLNVTITYNKEYKIQEVFTNLGKAGGCATAQLEALSKTVSLGIRRGVDSEVFAKTLTDIKCKEGQVNAGVKIESCADAIARCLKGEILSDGCIKKITGQNAGVPKITRGRKNKPRAVNKKHTKRKAKAK